MKKLIILLALWGLVVPHLWATLIAPSHLQVLKVFVKDGNPVFAGDEIALLKMADGNKVTMKAGASGKIVQLEMTPYKEFEQGEVLAILIPQAVVVEGTHVSDKTRLPDMMGLLKSLYETTGVAALIAWNGLDWTEGSGRLLMTAVGVLLLYLGIARGFEPLLLVPIGFGAIMSNIPVAGIAEPGGILYYVYQAGIVTGVFPLVIFMGVGAMTDFGPDLPGVFTAFPSLDVNNAIAKAIGANYRQLYISETEKYAHITYFINGGYAQALNGEDREVINSISIRSYAEKPTMSAEELTNRVLSYLQKEKYNFVCMNYPNADMVGHTGEFIAVQTAIQFVDEQVKKIVDEVVEKEGGQVLIVADHGNAEEMIDPVTGEISTEHTANPVPFIIIKKGMEGVKLRKGRLADVSPTLLKLMNLNKPKEMTGECLFDAVI